MVNLIKFVARIGRALNSTKFRLVNNFQFLVHPNFIGIGMTEEVPSKKLKMDLSRSVGTMCGAWRHDEEYGGLVLVYKTRDPGLSPNPTREEDFPENIEDVWVEGDSNDQVFYFKFRILF